MLRKRYSNLSLYLLVALGIGVIGCNQTPDPKTEQALEPSVKITTTQIEFSKDTPLKFNIDVYSPRAGNINVSLVSPTNVKLEKESFNLSMQANTSETITVQASIKRAGYYNITATVTSPVWEEPVAELFGFNAKSTFLTQANRASLQSQNQSGVETLEDHLDNLPKFTTPEDHAQLQTAQMFDDLKGEDGVRLDSRLDNVVFKKLDGTTTEPFNTVLQYLPGTGSGTPTPEDLTPPTEKQNNSGMRTQGIGCGLGDWAKVTAKISYLGKTFTLPNTKISVWDEHPYLGSSYVTGGFTDSNGDFTFQKPSCDWGAWWDYSKPDLYFIVESIDSRNIAVRNYLAPLGVTLIDSTYGVRTGTNWDTTASQFNVNLNANDSDAEHAVWLYRMVQLAQDFNVGAGGNGASYFPIRIIWPTRLNPAGWVGAGGGSFAPVAKLEIDGGHWFYPYIAWHEFGHNWVYRTAAPSGYQSTYDLGIGILGLPGFAFGTHYGTEQQNVELAFNEGFANYFYVMLEDHYNITFNPWLTSDNLRKCNRSCLAFQSGNENEYRVSTFLYRYTKEVLSASNSLGVQRNLGVLRSRLWNLGRYNFSFVEFWRDYLRSTLPAGYGSLTKQIADDTYFSLVGI
jgi:hypothetical protein